MLLAFDDTDSKEGGCTTHVAFHVLLALPRLALRSMPRLVRLNPNVPHKTRGNAAVVLDLGPPVGPSTRVGELRGREVHAFPEAPPAPATAEVLEAAWRAVEAASLPEASPAVALFDVAPPEAAYWQAVRTSMGPDEAQAGVEAFAATDAAGAALWRGAGARALAGCLGAAAWPGPASSYEFIAYREPSAIGTPRRVATGTFPFLDAAGATFHSYDARAGRPVGVPRTPCPVLCGLRGRDPERLVDASLRALAAPGTEQVDGWLLWATNQASGDHVTAVVALAEAPEWSTLAVAAKVVGRPERRQGGHVHVALEDPAGRPFGAVAFEPTHAFRDVVEALRPGDEVTALGALAEGLVRLEKLEVRKLATATRPLANPTCAACQRRMPSMGAGAGHRCRKCGARAPEGSATVEVEPRTLALGWHEVPVMARRHLHRPLAWDGVGRRG